MPDRGLCPECKQMLHSVDLEEITVDAERGQLAGFCLVCSNCRTVLGVGVNPNYSKELADLLEKPEGNGA